jgi:hypothetical protein
MSPTHVLDQRGLLGLFDELTGRKLVGAVDGFDCVELVFDDPERRGGNLVSIFTGGTHKGRIAHGFVSQDLIAAGYVSRDRERRTGR